jgi:hypothetical protein
MELKCQIFCELYVDFINSHADDESTVDHHYRCDIFMVVVDQQAQDSTNKQYIFLLCALPWTSRTHSGHNYRCDNLCYLSSKLYPANFEEREREILKCQLQHYEHGILAHPKFQNLTTISEICQQLAATGKK